MLKINKISNEIPQQIQREVKKEYKNLKKDGYKNLDVKVNKLGTTAILGYKTPEKDELVISSVINPDGRKQITTYKTFPHTKIIETFDKIKNDTVFNKRIIMTYDGISPIPEISVFKLNHFSNKTPEFYTKYPLD